MTVDDILRTFASAATKLPHDSMRWALDHWDQAGPKLIEVLDQFVHGKETSDQAASILFFALHLMAEKREKSVFPLLCQLVRDNEAIERVLDDGITVTLAQILISTFDGQLALLKALIEDEEADGIIRHVGFEVWAYLTHTGVVSHEETRAYLLDLYREMQPRGESFAWVGWTETAISLGFTEYRSLVEDLLVRGFIDATYMEIDEFDIDSSQDSSAPDLLFGNDRMRPLDDAIGELSGWYCFSPQGQQDQALRDGLEDYLPLSLSEKAEPYVNPWKSVGRNDPCPCGSGKKFKNCCLQ